MPGNASHHQKATHRYRHSPLTPLSSLIMGAGLPARLPGWRGALQTQKGWGPEGVPCWAPHSPESFASLPASLPTGLWYHCSQGKNPLEELDCSQLHPGNSPALRPSPGNPHSALHITAATSPLASASHSPLPTVPRPSHPTPPRSVQAETPRENLAGKLTAVSSSLDFILTVPAGNPASGQQGGREAHS